MAISFDDFFRRACEATGAKTQMELAALLGINRSAITQAKNRDAVPEKWLLNISRKFAVSPDWLEHGDEYQKKILRPVQLNSDAFRSGSGYASISTSRHAEPDGDRSEIISIPKISAVLCAGGGSFDVEGSVIDHIPLPSPMLHSIGNPGSMIFMDVSGDSMEPGIYNGDTVLIDQSFKSFAANTVLAVGYDETIFIKRLIRYADGGLGLISDNPAYEPIKLYGDEMDSFRIIGKVVWLFRKVI
ncbi:helix-turn-helix domain-containing protein [Desulfovibrio sp. OttesenSCG-928-C06]|nr:helix-turn-helix domain-containing protein [Desulfovibrio sp. OttesenSCG-928-C06]